MVLVHHYWWLSLELLSRNSSGFKCDSLGDLGDSDHLDTVLVSEHLKSVGLDLQHETDGLVVLEKDQVTRTVQLSD